MTRARTLPPLALLWASLLLLACGETEQPDEGLRWLEGEACEVSTGDEPWIERLSEALPGRLHEKLSGCLQRALEQGELPVAASTLEQLDTYFDGVVLVGERRVSRAAAFAAVLDAHLRGGRRRLEEGRGAGAREMLDAATSFALTEEDDRRIAGARAWMALTSAADLSLMLAAHVGPRVLLVVDDFHLGEALLRDVAARWALEGRASGLRVGVLPILRGEVRQGRRIVRASSVEEHASIAARTRAAGLVLEKGRMPSSDALETLGLDANEGAILVFNRDGLLVGRRIEHILDPRPLSRTVERVTSR